MLTKHKRKNRRQTTNVLIYILMHLLENGLWTGITNKMQCILRYAEDSPPSHIHTVYMEKYAHKSVKKKKKINQKERLMKKTKKKKKKEAKSTLTKKKKNE